MLPPAAAWLAAPRPSARSKLPPASLVDSAARLRQRCRFCSNCLRCCRFAALHQRCRYFGVPLLPVLLPLRRSPPVLSLLRRRQCSAARASPSRRRGSRAQRRRLAQILRQSWAVSRCCCRQAGCSTVSAAAAGRASASCCCRCCLRLPAWWPAARLAALLHLLPLQIAGLTALPHAAAAAFACPPGGLLLRALLAPPGYRASRPAG